MKIAVVGAGAMGSLFGALLSEAGNDVWLYDVWPEHIQAITERGLSIEGEAITRVVDGAFGIAAEAPVVEYMEML